MCGGWYVDRGQGRGRQAAALDRGRSGLDGARAPRRGQARRPRLIDGAPVRAHQLGRLHRAARLRARADAHSATGSPADPDPPTSHAPTPPPTPPPGDTPEPDQDAQARQTAQADADAGSRRPRQIPAAMATAAAAGATGPRPTDACKHPERAARRRPGRIRRPNGDDYDHETDLWRPANMTEGRSTTTKGGTTTAERNGSRRTPSDSGRAGGGRHDQEHG